MGLFTKNESEFNIKISSWKLEHVHARVLIFKTIPFFLNQYGYKVNEFDVTDNESIKQWMNSNIGNYNMHWSLTPPGTVDMKITTNPLTCKVKICIPGLDIDEIEKLPKFMNVYAEDKFGAKMIDIRY